MERNIHIPNDRPDHPSEQAKPVNELEQPKKTPQDNLSNAEKRRYEEIVTIQHYLSQGYSPSQIRELMHSTKASNDKNSGLASFVNGLKMDIDAVRNSVISELSNGFVEGINNKVKVIKRTM